MGERVVHRHPPRSREPVAHLSHSVDGKREFKRYQDRNWLSASRSGPEVPSSRRFDRCLIETLALDRVSETTLSPIPVDID